MKDDEEDVISGQVSLNEEFREIYIFGGITGEVASQVFYALRLFDTQSCKEIEMTMCSPGGEEPAGWAIYDAIRLARPKITGLVYGECSSIATLILQACDHRFLAPNCTLLLHNGSIPLGLMQQDKLMGVAEKLQKQTHLYYEKMAEKSQLTVAEVKKLCDNETTMSAETAVGYGFADGILEAAKKKGKR